MAGEKPTAAFVLGLIGGVLILLEGLLLVIAASVASSFGSFPGMPVATGFLEGLLMAIAAIVLIFALVVILSSVMLYMRPDGHVAWGVILLLFSIISLIFAGGFYIGGILGLVGGILGIVFRPSPQMPMAPYMPPPMAPPPQ